ncbi:CRISPR system precrRNA processing endoribonuclease RAMP protein Cas6 [Clostridiales Family XIII bacterium ASD5510]|uniref:CRISPR system precrRNA processing endoribonuclease RAMP protein Cas6 n=1 Tax=Hominibacterium faecale TaxID=2839743 RepID=A0A9J6QM06_9FIRM|nr:CRISPR system precrRNA processing endoribonuclease RAMP protein Cas6 [Hominibacterium faecale]MCU7378496.1 CRISPR system precrRNA processing endoribonuclease RAMP protein Cas6 [Hominibacterium faecale]
MKPEASFFLNYLPMEVTLISMDRAELPLFLGSTLRGVIGQTLRQDREAYNYLYNNRALSGNLQDTVNPYMIRPPMAETSVYLKGEKLTFHVILFGDAVRYTPQLIFAIEGIGRRGLGAGRYPFQLDKITHSLDQRVIWQAGIFHEVAVRSAALPCRSLSSLEQVRLKTLTPLRIRRNGKLLEQVDFPTIVRNITRRIERLCERYGGWIDEKEAQHIQALATDVSTIKEQLKLVNLNRYSNRTGEKMDFSGLMGELWFEGPLTPFVPWLYAAQTLNIGRNTTFGMGRVKVEFL